MPETKALEDLRSKIKNLLSELGMLCPDCGEDKRTCGHWSLGTCCSNKNETLRKNFEDYIGRCSTFSYFGRKESSEYEDQLIEVLWRTVKWSVSYTEAEIERLQLYESEHERLKGKLNDILYPRGNGPRKPMMCDLVGYVDGDLRKLREALFYIYYTRLRDDRGCLSPICKVCDKDEFCAYHKGLEALGITDKEMQENILNWENDFDRFFGELTGRNEEKVH